MKQRTPDNLHIPKVKLALTPGHSPCPHGGVYQSPRCCNQAFLLSPRHLFFLRDCTSISAAVNRVSQTLHVKIHL